MAYLVQQKTGSKGATGTTITVTLDSPPHVGNTLIGCFAVSDEAQTVSTVTGGGVTWARRKQNTANATSHSTSELWEGPNSDGTSSAIIVTYSGTAEGGANVNEWHGMFYSNPDVTAVGNASSTAPVSGTATTTLVPAIAFGMAYYKNTTAPSAGPTNSFIALTNTTVSTVGTLVCAYKFVGAAASTSTGWTITSAAWSGLLATFGISNIAMVNYQDVRVADNGNAVMSVTEKIK